MKTYAIENGSGEWWTGECFGVEQAREVYDSLDALPEVIETNGGIELELTVFASDDARYYVEGSEESEARVREVSA